VSALDRAEENGDTIEKAMDYMMDSTCPAYCANCGYIGELEHDFRGPCFKCDCKDAGSLMHLLGVI